MVRDNFVRLMMNASGHTLDQGSVVLHSSHREGTQPGGGEWF